MPCMAATSAPAASACRRTARRRQRAAPRAAPRAVPQAVPRTNRSPTAVPTPEARWSPAAAASPVAEAWAATSASMVARAWAPPATTAAGTPSATRAEAQQRLASEVEAVATVAGPPAAEASAGAEASWVPALGTTHLATQPHSTRRAPAPPLAGTCTQHRMRTHTAHRRLPEESLSCPTRRRTKQMWPPTARRDPSGPCCRRRRRNPPAKAPLGSSGSPGRRTPFRFPRASAPPKCAPTCQAARKGSPL
mmetsp:Transcript_29999/g.86337  ORF Transcript_29999/g.86337 Transcript_29999/m.86337 type:complete len:250 (-) Transcript_29999:547-1296(-)